MGHIPILRPKESISFKLRRYRFLIIYVIIHIFYVVLEFWGLLLKQLDYTDDF